MRIVINQKIESAHQWIDESGNVKNVLKIVEAGEVLDSDALAAEGVGDIPRWFDKLKSLGLATDE